MERVKIRGRAANVLTVMREQAGEQGFAIGYSLDLLRKLMPKHADQQWMIDGYFEESTKLKEVIRKSLVPISESGELDEIIYLLTDEEIVIPNSFSKGAIAGPRRPAICRYLYVNKSCSHYDAIEKLKTVIERTVGGNNEQGKQKRRYSRIFELYLLSLLHLRGSVEIKAMIRPHLYRIADAQSWLPIRGNWIQREDEIADDVGEVIPRFHMTPRKAIERIKVNVRNVRETDFDSDQLLSYRQQFIDEIQSAPDIIYREDLLGILANYVASRKERKTFCIVGGPGSGKSTIIRAFLKREFARGIEHPHFLIDPQRGERARPSRLLIEIALMIEPTIGHELISHRPSTVGEAADLLEYGLQKRSKITDIPLCLFIDGIDEADPPNPGEISFMEHLIRLQSVYAFYLVSSSQPSPSIDQLFDTIEISIGPEPEQESAIFNYILHLGNDGRIPEEALRKIAKDADGSYIFAELLVQELYGNIQTEPVCNDADSIKSHESVLENIRRRLLRDPLSDSTISDIISLVSVLQELLPMTDIAEVLDIDQSSVKEFFRRQGHLFQFEIDKSGQVITGECVQGFAHNVIRKFFLEHLVGKHGVQNAHGKFVNRLEHLGLPNMGAGIGVYLRSHICYHAAHCGDTSRLFDIASLEFFKNKMSHPNGLASCVADCDYVISVAHAQNEPWIMFRYGYIRNLLLGRRNLKFLNLLRVAKTLEEPTSEVLQEIESLGRPDDYLRALSQRLAAQHGIIDTGELQYRILEVAEKCSAEALEYCAVTVFDASATLSLKIIRQLPETGFLKEYGGDKVETPNVTRCLQILMRTAAQDNHTRAKELIVRVDAMNWLWASFSLRVFHGIEALDHYPREAVGLLEEALGIITDDDLKIIYLHFLENYILCRGKEFSDDSMACSLEFLNSQKQRRYRLLAFELCLNERILRQPEYWSRFAQSINDGWVQDIIRIRLSALGFVTILRSYKFSDALLQQMGDAELLASSILSEEDDHRIQSDQLTSPVALASIIRRLADSSSICEADQLESVLSGILRNLETSRDREGLEIYACLLNVVLNHSMELSGKWIESLLALLKKVQVEGEPYFSIRVLGDTLMKYLRSIDDKAIIQLGTLLVSISSQENRFLILKLILRESSIDDMDLIEAMVLSHLIQDSGQIANSFDDECRAYLLLEVTRCFGDANPGFAETLLVNVAAIIQSLSDGEARKHLCEDLIYVHLIVSPSKAWEAYSRCGMNLHMMANAVRHITVDLVRTEEHWESNVLRLQLERFLHPNAQGNSRAVGEFQFTRKLLAWDLTREHISIPGTLSNLCSEAWTAELPRFARSFLDNMGTDYAHRTVLKPLIAKFLARADWQTFMVIARDSDIGPYIAGDLDAEELLPEVLRASSLNIDLLSDIAYLEQLIEPISYPVDTVVSRVSRTAYMPMRNQALCLLATKSPKDCLWVIRNIHPDVRYGFCRYSLNNYTPESYWQDHEIVELLRLFPNRENVSLIAHAAVSFVRWQRSESVPSAMVEDTLRSIFGRLSEHDLTTDLCKALKFIMPDMAQSFAQTMLSKSDNATSPNDRVDLLEEFPELMPEIRISVANKAFSDALDKDDWQLALRTLKIIAMLDIKHALRCVLRYQESGHNSNECIRELAEASESRWKEQITTLTSRQTRVADKDPELIERYLAELLIRTAPKHDSDVCVEDIIEDPALRIRCFLATLESVPNRNQQQIRNKVEEEIFREPYPGMCAFAYYELARLTAQNDPVRACLSFESAIKEIDRVPGCVQFVSSISMFSPFLIQIEPEVRASTSTLVATYILGRSLEENFTSNVPGAQLEMYLNAALVAWGISGDTLQTVLEQISLESREYFGDDISMWTKGLRFAPTESLVALAHNIDDIELSQCVTTLLELIPDHSRSIVADAFLRGLPGFESPRNYKIRNSKSLESKLGKTELRLIEVLTPFAGKEAQMMSRLNLAESEYSQNTLRSRKLIQDAIENAKELGSQQLGILDQRRYVWNTYMYFGGEKSVLECIDVLLHQSTDFGNLASELLDTLCYGDTDTEHAMSELRSIVSVSSNFAEWDSDDKS